MRRNRMIVTAVVLTVGLGTVGADSVVVNGANAAPEPAPTSDFDGDGHPELVVPASSANAGGMKFAGGIAVYGGSASGPVRSDARRVDPSSKEIPGELIDRGFFGHSSASGDFNGDGFADLAVCEEAEMPRPALKVIFGGEDGLRKGIAPGSMPDAAFCKRVVSGDFDKDGYADVAVLRGAGSVDWAKGGPEAADTGAWKFEQVAEGDTEFGFFEELAVGDVVTGQSATVAGKTYGGVVMLWYGSEQGIDFAADPVVFHQDSPGVPGVAEPHDNFGSSLAVGDMNGDKRAEIAAGTPSEGDRDTTNAGSVTIVPGGDKGPVLSGSRLYYQGAPGIPGAVETGDHFGEALVMGVFAKDGLADLVVGTPDENRGEGLVHVLPDLEGGRASVFDPRDAGIDPEHARFGGYDLRR